MTENSRRYAVQEICEKLGIPREFLVDCLRAHWIVPASPEESLFDEEDVARLGLIRELREDFGVNREAIALILHLLDQIYFLRARLDAENASDPGY